MRHPLRPLFALCTCLPVCSVLAAILPDAGRLIQDIESTPLSIPTPQRLDLTLPESGNEQVTAGGPKLSVKAFRLSGNQAIPSSELLPLLDDLKGRDLGLAELQQAAWRLSNHYRQRGYPLARAYLPPQEIDRGIVEIALLEGRYGQIRLQNGSRIGDRVLAGPLSPLESGAAVEGKALERSLLLLQDTPGVEVRSTLRPGASVGTTDLIVETRPAPLLSGSLDADNHGNRFMGQNRLGLTLNLNSPLGLGDLLTLRGMRSDEGQNYRRIGYQLPLGPAGTQLGVAYSDMDYELSKDFDELDAHGNARIVTAFVLQPLIRSRAFNLYGHLQFEDKFLEDDIDLFSSRSDKRLRNWSATLSGNAQDSLGGVTGFALTYTHGDLNIDSGDVERLDAATARTQGSFNKWNPAILRLQRLTERLSLYIHLQAQLSDGNLDSAEKFWLGGPYGVRAYPQGEATGDQGWLANIELRYALTPAWQFSTFIDHGEVHLNEDTWDAGDNHRRLSGAGVGISWNDHGWRISVVSAWKLGSERTESDVNRTPRLWAQLVRYF
ncbi:ShlB/FhaC/HecB family hemolysin secretion/activation protein [Azotobacter vinelandii]|uniref:ShlB/FhaC/HecB family hemolysin secretion/activation protein n=1 Tax=Azotobacter vinelandii TaxID=354 RepID=UPI000773FE50|nr:ShlB/FhaC/HecB family hemolysin secretion/activation protein [Azotobacter vinelandii]